MRALPIVSVLVLSLSALAACSSDSEGRPPSGGAGAPPVGGAGAGGAIVGGGGAPGTAGATPGAGAPGTAGTTAGAGAPGTAGTTGGGGAPAAGCAMTKAGLGTDGLIDDFEAHVGMTPNIPATDGRIGGWWISKNATATVTVPAMIGNAYPADGGKTGKGLHLVGTDTDETMGWGADASVAIAAANNCYDASAYKGGVKISLKGNGSVYVQVLTAESKAASATSGHFRKEIPLTAEWADYTIPWTELATGWGTPLVLDLKTVAALDIAPSASSAKSFDIWIDNVSFY